MSDTLNNVLIEAIDDEYKACATYRLVISKFGEIRPFTNIVEAESRHIQALLPLFKKYGITIPENNWDSRIQAPGSIMDACRDAVLAETENAEMYNRLLNAVKDYPDVEQVLRQLQRASTESHLPAFKRCVERGSVQVEGRGQQRQRRRHGQHSK